MLLFFAPPCCLWGECVCFIPEYLTLPGPDSAYFPLLIDEESYANVQYGRGVRMCKMCINNR